MPGDTYLLNSPADTAALGDPEAWRHAPFAAEEEDGWLYGRGSADSKSGIAVFCHVAREIRRRARSLRGSLILVFDADEHSGAFSGIRRAVEDLPIAGAFIGYPGHDRVIIGCRGFYRASVRVHGVSAHSGSSKRQGVNAIYRANRLVAALEQLGERVPSSARFPLPPAVSVTAIQGGEGYSTVPDRCDLDIDCRLTPEFGADWAERQLSAAISQLDRGCPVPATEMKALPGWPAYQLSPNSRILQALRSAGNRVLGHDLPMEVAGPSSVGNYLATRGIDATSGFGCRYRNLHAADECIETGSLEPTFAVYLQAISELLS
jgi:succinyl-diaminopimelate desuccinylase